MQGLLQDIRVALRGLARRPGFTLAVVLTLALGIGANSAIFSIIYGVLLRPFPYERVDRLARVWQRLPAQGIERAPVAPATFAEWRDQNGTFEALACFAPAFATLTGQAEPQEVQAIRASADLFRVLGTPPALGRGFLAGEDRPGAAPVVVLCDRLWRETFAARRDVLGTSITLDGTGYQVVGVMPPEFALEEAELWLPLVFAPEELMSRGRGYLEVAGRLRDGVSFEQAQANLAAIAQGRAQDLPSEVRLPETTLVPLYEQVVGDIRPTLLVLMGAVGFVLLIGAGLLVRSFQRLQAVDPGFDPDGVLTAFVNLPPAEYAEDSRKLALAGQTLDLSLIHI